MTKKDNLLANNASGLCFAILSAESESDVIAILKRASLWEDNASWQTFGAKENNYSVIGAQQADPVAALVEKLVNSVDAVLMRECLLKNINPESEKAPKSIADALSQYFEIKDGNLANVSPPKRRALAENIGLISTGQRSKPNYIIFDRGEGQTPDNMSSTFLSITESNKLRIPFVQGKFNMGGTGVLRFCGHHSIQLIISRRHPTLKESNDWGFTVVRREDPSGNLKNSVYRYLAPNGHILRFNIPNIDIPLVTHGTQEIPNLEWGTIIKLYEYEMTGYRTNILLDLYNQISLLLPRVGLPIRFYERRGYEGHTLETTMSGLHVRLDEDKQDNLEPGFPTSAEFSASGQKFRALIYAFKIGAHQKYRKNEGILFTYSGQTHGNIPKSFFTRKNVGMSYLADSILVIVDCDAIDLRSREILFMNSRDRLSSGDLRSDIDKKLEEIIGGHQGLKELRERRKRRAAESMLADMKPLKEALESILKKSPALQALFIQGRDISNPFKIQVAGSDVEYEGKQHPTYFRLLKGHAHKKCNINLRFRVQFETDAVNDYFIRDRYPGHLRFNLNGSEVTDLTFNLWNGVATLTVGLPAETKIGDTIFGEVFVDDETLITPFHSEFERLVEGPIKSNGGGGERRPPVGSGSDGRQVPNSLSLPEVHRVKQDEWELHGFNKYSALKVVDDGEGAHQFYVNVDNVFLRTEIKALPINTDPRLLEARFEYGLVMFGLALLIDKDELIEQNEGEENPTISDLIFQVSQSFAPILLPMIEALSQIESDDVKAQPDFEYEN